MSALPFLVIIGLFVGGYCFVMSASRWDRGLHLLIIAVFFGGIVAVNLGSGAYSILFRDAFIVLPLYLGFFFRRVGQASLGKIPADLVLTLGLFLTSIFLGLFNSLDEPALELMIGLKVWVFYIPFLAIGLALAADPQRMLRFFHQMLYWGGAAAAIGLAQSVLVRLIGYERAIGLFFGAHASAVTQAFSYFEEAGGIYRIPGTFSFVSQYSVFLHFYVSVAMIEVNFDPSPKIRRLAQYALFLAILAAVLSGAREAIISIPLTLVLFAVCGLLKSRLLLAVPIGAALGFAALEATGLELVKYFYYGQELAGEYSISIWSMIGNGFDYGILGRGIGSATGSARYAFSFTGDLVDNGALVGFDSYIAKGAAELGYFGFAAVALTLFFIVARCGFTVLQNWARREKFVVAPLAIVVSFGLVSCLKGNLLDVDPGNILTWLFVGLMIGVSRRVAYAAPVFEAELGSVPSPFPYAPAADGLGAAPRDR